MRYTVVWKPAAEANLAELWANAPDRAAVTRAAAELDRLLAAEGAAAGESRAGGRRVAFALPLGGVFEMAGPVVVVLRVWAPKRRR